MIKYLILQLIVLLIVNFEYTCGYEDCWNNNKNECIIKTELFQNLDFSNGISMQIDCIVNMESRQDQEQARVYDNHQTYTNNLLRRFMGIQSVTLDGCQTPLNMHTYGLEFLPICVNITRAYITHFHMDTLIPLQCNKEENSNLQLEYFYIKFNEIATIDGESFATHYPQLRDVVIESNSLKAIQSDTFKSLKSLENLRIVNEPVLMLKSVDLFEYTSLLAIHLEALKQMTSEIFHHLPETLQNFYVADTQLDSDAVVVNNALVLKNLTIANCALRKFTLHDIHSTVNRINLSGNTIKVFNAYENDLKELSLSNNQLDYFPSEWLKNLTNLENLILKGNQIQMLSLNGLLQAIPNGHVVDIRGNRLQSLQDCETIFLDQLLSPVRLKCDRNPWDCLWLHDFAHKHPEKFRILQYEKFISKINVNGLECIPAESPNVQPIPYTMSNTNIAPSTPLTPITTSTEAIMNVSTYNLVYGYPWEFKRNQRAEALIIVFMLPLGIALLFLLLYMWIYCQKMFHLSYYQNFSCMRSPVIPNPSQRFDVVRQVPPNHIQSDVRGPYTGSTYGDDDGGYEVPLSDVISECNCKAHNTIEKCNKTFHITYEHLPTDVPHQIYEEIIHVDDGGGEQKQNHVTYDHLSFD